jgi:hypothetical protein
LNADVDSFEVSINGTISGATGPASHARLEAFSVKLFLEGHDPIQPIMVLPVDEIHGGSDVEVIKNNVHVPIEDEAALDEFALKLMDNDLLRIAMRGRTEMWLGKIHTGIDYNEVVSIKGMPASRRVFISAWQWELYGWALADPNKKKPSTSSREWSSPRMRCSPTTLTQILPVR